MMRAEWSPQSWRRKAAAQQAEYPDPAELARIVAELGALPPLVHYREIEALKLGLAGAAAGKSFVLQGGDCAESFEDCGSDSILAKLAALLQMSLILRHGTGIPVLCLGRLAGQYAKPRSQLTETRDGVTLPSYRGDIINRIEFTRAGRVADPSLLLRGYERSALTLNCVRTLAASLESRSAPQLRPVVGDGVGDRIASEKKARAARHAASFLERRISQWRGRCC